MGSLIGLWCIYSFLPTIYYKFIYKEKYKKGQVEFSFDDGPNPLYTPTIIKLLNDNNIKSTFFVVGEKVEKYPDLVKEAYNSGHKIGLHCYKHSHPIFWEPIKTKRDMTRAKEALEKIGIKPSFYRPPHGWVNLTMLLILSNWQLPLKLWTCIPGDWKEDKSIEELYNCFKNKKNDGCLVCLHDSNHKLNSSSKAPLNTIGALEKYFRKE